MSLSLAVLILMYGQVLPGVTAVVNETLASECQKKVRNVRMSAICALSSF